MQGAGAAYGLQVDEKVGQMEENARAVLMDLGNSQMSYARKNPSGKYGYFTDLVLAGYLQPNATTTSVAAGYSIVFYLPPKKLGFTMIAEPVDIRLRPILLDENMQVVPLIPTLDQDPDPEWLKIRDSMLQSYINYRYYQFPYSIQLMSHKPPLQVRINQNHKNYILFALREDPTKGMMPDNSMIWMSSLNSYFVGDTRQR